MKRREFVALIGGAVAAWPRLAYAQQTSDRVRRIGALMAYTKDDPEDQQRVAAFQDGLKQSGWIEGRNIRSDYRWYAGDVDRARFAAKELVELKPDVILVGASLGLVTLRRRPRSGGESGAGFTFFEFSVGAKLLEAQQQI